MVELPELGPYNYYMQEQGYVLQKGNQPMARILDASESDMQLMVYLLNHETARSWFLGEKVKILMAHDEDRKEYQRILENKIRRLKERIRQLEK